jgi:hypothetical protein
VDRVQAPERRRIEVSRRVEQVVVEANQPQAIEEPVGAGYRIRPLGTNRSNYFDAR